MKVIQFTVPVSGENTIIVQEDILPHYYPHLHRHREVQIEWVVDGSGILIAGNYMQPFETGDVYIIGANQSHIFKSDETYFDHLHPKEVHSISIFFDPGRLAQNLLSFPEMISIRKFIETLHSGFKIPNEYASEVTTKIRDIMQHPDALRVSAFIELLHLFSSKGNLIPLSQGNSDHIISEGEGIRMDQIFRYLVENYKNQVTLREISSVASMTPQAFCRYFKKHTSKTFVLFLSEIRVNEACKLIVSSKHDSIAEISYQTGFESVANFNRVFKKIVGKAPGEYLKDYKRNVKQLE